MSEYKDGEITPVTHVTDVTNTCRVCGLDYLDEHISVDESGAMCLNCKKNNTITLIRVGYGIEGIAKIHMWGGGVGYVKMQSFELTVPDISLDISDDELNAKIEENLNDGGFGCETIDGAIVYINNLYEHGFMNGGSECYIGNITEDDADAINDIGVY